VDETSSLHMEMGRKTTMVKNNQVGDDNTLTSVRISTLFTEATRTWRHWCSSFSPKLL